MLPNTSVDLPSKPRVLIADDSKIVRATLIKHIQGMFDFREALNGEEAWEALLIDPTIRVVITDLSMPKLDGYGLLNRIRSSEISRIRSLPVVVVSGSDERTERDRARAAGATDLITKGIDTTQLLSRLEILSKLVNTQREFERSLEVLANNASAHPVLPLDAPTVLSEHAENGLANALRNSKNFVILTVVVGLKHTELDGQAVTPPSSVVHAVGQLLQRTIRQSDRVAQTGEAEFTLATGNIHFDSARNFAQRICRAIASANMVKDDHMSFVASCGLASLSENYPEPGMATPTALSMQQVAQRRAMLGLNLATTGVVGLEEEQAFGEMRQLPVSTQAAAAVMVAVATDAAPSVSFFESSERRNEDAAPIDLSTLVQWIKEGQEERVLRHMSELSEELQPLVELLLKQGK